MRIPLRAFERTIHFALNFIAGFQDVPEISAGSRVAVVNLTPYDGTLEKACLKSVADSGPRTRLMWDLKNLSSFLFLLFSCRMPTYSFGEEHLIVKYSERMVAQYLLEDTQFLHLF